MAAEPYLFQNGDSKFHLVYAGALLPKAKKPLECLCQSIAANANLFEDICLHFIGTGTSPDDPEGYKVRPMAEQYGLWGSVIFEHPPRIPYLDALVHQEEADAVFILGSTEPHYTPSKVYQAVLAGKPIFAVLHQASSACDVVRKTNAGYVLDFDGSSDLSTLQESFAAEMVTFRRFADRFDPEQVDRSAFHQYSARNVTRQLVDALEEALCENVTCITR
jgi:hypothetical protein